MLTQPPGTTAIVGQKAFPAQQAVSDKFGAVADLIASEFTYKKDEEIFGEDEPAEYVY
ncbi:MAG: nitrogen fixation protein FixK, partial [Bradyrhizobium sp.]